MRWQLVRSGEDFLVVDQTPTTGSTLPSVVAIAGVRDRIDALTTAANVGHAIAAPRTGHAVKVAASHFDASGTCTVGLVATCSCGWHTSFGYEPVDHAVPLIDLLSPITAHLLGEA